MRFIALLSLLLLSCSLSFASFTYLYSLNGSGAGDSDDSRLFSQPSGILFAAGKLYVTDIGKTALYIYSGTSRERFLSSSGGVDRFSNPLRMKYESGTLYVADGISAKVKMYSGAGNTVDEWNTASNMEKITSLEFDSSYAYITDISKQQVYRYSRSNRAYVSVAIPFGPSDGQLSAPADIQYYKGSYYVSDQEKGMIFVYDSNFTFQSAIGRGRGGITLTSPRGFQVADDMIYVADTTSNRIVVYTLDGYPIDILNSSTLEGNFSYPEDVSIDTATNTLYVTDTLNRQVKAFSVSITSGNDSVMKAIGLAKFSLGQLQTVQQVATRLNVSFQLSPAADDIAQAESDYDNYMYSSASVLAGKARDEAVSSQASLEQGIDLKIRQMAKAASDRVAPYRARATGALAPQLLQFDNRIADVNAKLSSKSYSAAADAALQLAPSAESLVSAVEGKAAADEEKGRNTTTSSFSQSISLLDSQMQQLEAKAAAYRQDANFSNAEKLIASAQAAATEGDFEAANYSLSLAALEINATSASLAQAALEIDAARLNFTIIELEFNSTVSKGTLVPADLSQERKLMAQANDALYSNPQLGLAMARQATNDAAAKMKDTQAISLAAAAVVSIFGGIALIAGAFYIHLMRRRSRAKQDNEGERHESRRSEEGHMAYRDEERHESRHRRDERR